MLIADLNPRRFKVGGFSYFVAGAHACQIGGAGEKRSPVGKPKFVDIHAQVDANRIGTLRQRVLDVAMTVAQSNGFGSVVPLMISGVPAAISVDDAARQITSSDLKLIHLMADEGPLKKATNDSPRILDDLIDWGPDARLIQEIFVVAHYDVAQKFMTSDTFMVGVGTGGMMVANIGGNGGRAGTIQLELSPGSVMAYLPAKPRWDAKLKKNRSRIEELLVDQKGTG